MEVPLDVAVTVEQCWQPVPGGSGTYVVELTRQLALRPDVSVRGLAARHDGPAPADWAPAGPTVHSRLPRVLLYESWNRLGRPSAERTLGSAPDVVHATTWAVPPTRAPSVVTVHDLAFLRNPEHFTPRGVQFFRRALDRVRQGATLVIVPSRATADDCVDAGIPAERLRVVHHGVRVAVPSRERLTAFRHRHGLPARYVLWCGTQEPRKNLPRLLRAFAAVADAEPDLHLVLVGPPGWRNDGVAADVARLPGRVHVLGHLAWEDLQCAYAGATAFCFPSLWEGFGMPVVEAMAHGVPVVTSAGSSMAELLQGAGVLVDPTDEGAIADGVLASVGGRHADLARASRERASAFSWERAAALTVDAYREAARA